MDVPVYDYKIVYPTNLDECRDPELLNGMPTVSSKVDEMGVADLAHELQKCQDQIWQELPHTHVEFTYGAIVVALIAITVIIIVVWVAMASVYRKHKAMMAARAEKEKENETNFFGLTAAQKADNASVENLDERINEIRFAAEAAAVTAPPASSADDPSPRSTKLEGPSEPPPPAYESIKGSSA